MDFKVVGTVVVVLLSLGLLLLATSRLTKKEKSFSDIISSAENGREDYLQLTPEEDMNLCDFLEARAGCDSELGVEPSCRLQKGISYIIRAYPVEAGVCLNVTEAGEW
jgi:hypothetical protein